MRWVFLAVAAASVCIASPRARAVDWSAARAKDIVLFYPAQMSWELLLTQSEHSGADKFRAGKDCRACHEGEEASSGNLMVTDKNAEPTPIPGKPGSIKATVRAAHDDDRLYIRIDFAPGQQPDAGMDKQYATKVAVMIDDGKVAEAARAGCWAVCHDNLVTMPSAAPAAETTKYLARSRVGLTRHGSDQLKSADELAQMRAQGMFMEYWQARLTPDAPPVVVDGTILERRQENPRPLATATASLASNGTWTVIFSRKLLAGPGAKDFVPGKTYTIGFSIHAGHTARRFHYVSLEKTLVIDQGTADLIAARQ